LKTVHSEATATSNKSTLKCIGAKTKHFGALAIPHEAITKYFKPPATSYEASAK
jgi:hypothetical protein